MEFGKNFHALIQVVHLPKVGNYAEQMKGVMTSNLHVVAALPADLQFRLGLPDL
ncbi:hypothetical protein T02_7135 [Trichinella nativa]|uniref:Uncharacterized protein n=1 Tax=Trichinella nativa TaxID=6335 RepID=A0A0V1LTY5_9BILA|nr:hypothetical protein T02_7135 [Trichinella nativa]